VVNRYEADKEENGKRKERKHITDDYPNRCRIEMEPEGFQLGIAGWMGGRYSLLM
jgi:hypothetical protein